MTDQEKIIEEMARGYAEKVGREVLQEDFDFARYAHSICAPAVRERCAEELETSNMWFGEIERRTYQRAAAALREAALPLDGLTGGKGESEATAAKNIVLALDALANRYFDYRGVEHLEPFVKRARSRYDELKAKGLSFEVCSAQARAEMVRSLLAAPSAPAPVQAGMIEALSEAIEFAEQDAEMLWPAGRQMVERWKAALAAASAKGKSDV